jgi:hypothetical protein
MLTWMENGMLGLMFDHQSGVYCIAPQAINFLTVF